MLKTILFVLTVIFPGQQPEAVHIEQEVDSAKECAELVLTALTSPIPAPAKVEAVCVVMATMLPVVIPPPQQSPPAVQSVPRATRSKNHPPGRRR